MTIRKDLKQVEGLISRLISIGKEFEALDGRLSHMKHREDFEKVYSIKDQKMQNDIKSVYATGHDIAIYMSDALQLINVNFNRYPTLTSIIQGFDGTWVYEDLSETIKKADAAYKMSGLNLWSVTQMVSMFNDQIRLLQTVKQTLDLLKDSDLYKSENGINWYIYVEYR